MAKDREAAAAERARNPFPGYDDAFAAAMDAEARPTGGLSRRTGAAG